MPLVAPLPTIMDLDFDFSIYSHFFLVFVPIFGWLLPVSLPKEEKVEVFALTLSLIIHVCIFTFSRGPNNNLLIFSSIFPGKSL